MALGHERGVGLIKARGHERIIEGADMPELLEADDIGAHDIERGAEPGDLPVVLRSRPAIAGIDGKTGAVEVVEIAGGKAYAFACHDELLPVDGVGAPGTHTDFTRSIGALA